MPQLTKPSQNLENVVAYARYSTEGQREESIDAQLRAIRDHAKKHNMRIVEIYADREKSGTNDRRPEFQRMIADSNKKEFTQVIVHKMDRFSRSVEDAVKYLAQLRRNGVEVVSTKEQFDDSPLGEAMRQIALVWAEMYSKNLSGEVEKGKRENAYKGMHVGGKPPLGYDIDPVTKKLIINEKEAESIKLIFSMYLDGHGYQKIIDKLNSLNYKTKKGNDFGKNSLYELLRNEKYTGTFVYNRSSATTPDGKFNRHKLKPEEEIIRVENTHPAIVSKEDFERVAQKKKVTKKNAASYTAKEVYLLSGKVVCGECGSKYNGMNRPPRGRNPQYTSYRCSRRNGSLKCKNSEIRREATELFVLDKLANYLFSDEMSDRLFKGYYTYFLAVKHLSIEELKVVKREIETISADIEKLIDLMVQTNSAAMADRLQALEERKQQLQEREEELKGMTKSALYKKSYYKKTFDKARKRLLQGKLAQTKNIIEKFVDRVEIYKDSISVYFNFDGEERQPIFGTSLGVNLDTKIPQNHLTEDDSTVIVGVGLNSIIETMDGRGRRT